MTEQYDPILKHCC